MVSFQITVDLCKASGTKVAHFQTILRYSVPIYVWIYENGVEEFNYSALSGRFFLARNYLQSRRYKN